MKSPVSENKVCKRISALTCAYSFEELGFRVDRSFFLVKTIRFQLTPMVRNMVKFKIRVVGLGSELKTEDPTQLKTDQTLKPIPPWLG